MEKRCPVYQCVRDPDHCNYCVLPLDTADVGNKAALWLLLHPEVSMDMKNHPVCGCPNRWIHNLCLLTLVDSRIVFWCILY